MFRERDVSKYIADLHLFGHTISLEYDKLRGTNHKILKLNPDFALNNETRCALLVKTIRECANLKYFRRLEFINVYSEPTSDFEKYLQEYWVFRIQRETKLKRIAQRTTDLVVYFL